jgi:hypothetical protein
MSKKTLESYAATKTTKLPNCSSEQCHNCFITSSSLKKCSICKSVEYCSENCQKKNWNEHKTLCKGLKEYNSKVSETKENLKKFSRKNLLPMRQINYNVVLGNTPTIYTTMTLKEISTIFSDFMKNRSATAELMACVFQKSICEDRDLCLKIVQEIIIEFSRCNNVECPNKKLSPQLEWFTKNLNNCLGFFGKNSIYDESMQVYYQSLQYAHENLKEIPNQVFDVLFKIFENFENPETYLDGFAGQYLLPTFLNTSKEKKIIKYMNNVFKNFQDFEHCLISEVLALKCEFRNKESLDLDPKIILSLNIGRLENFKTE